MNIVDIVTMLGNLGQSLTSVDRLVTAVSYLAGLVIIYTGVFKLKHILNASGRSQERSFEALAYIVAGIALLFLPTSIRIFSTTIFGSENILSYANYDKWNIFASMGILLKTVGLIWFVRGCIMIVHASKPGEQSGMRGFFFLITGILAMNFVWTMSTVNYIINVLVNWSITFNKPT